MFDCANVEMRELLPELAAGTLDAATRSRVERHVASCAECASEVETLRLVRSAYRTAPPVEYVLMEHPDPNGPFGAKGIAEPPILPVAAAVANAVSDAVGKPFDTLPITPFAVLAALQLLLEPAVVHALDQEERPHADLDARVLAGVGIMCPACIEDCERREGQHSERQRAQSHEILQGCCE